MPSIEDSVYEMVKEYRIRPYQGRVLLVLARDQAMFGFKDPTLGWRDFVSNTLEVRSVPGNHFSMLEGRDVEHVAAILQELLGSEFSGEAPAAVPKLGKIKFPA
jgi:thioesterase domain-containing protein